MRIAREIRILMLTILSLACKCEENFDLFPKLPESVIDSDNVICKDQSRMYLEHLRNLSLWAHQMRDATAKSTTGLLTGSVSNFGQFEECLGSKSPFKTQYCLASITANVPKPDPPRDDKSLIYDPNESVLRKIYLHVELQTIPSPINVFITALEKSDLSQQPVNMILMGWCVPASCRPNELQHHLNKYLEKGQFYLKQKNVTYRAEIGESSCQKEDENQHLDHADISFGLVVVIIITLVTFSTAYDIFKPQTENKLDKPSQLTKLLTTFSISKNYNKLSGFPDQNPALSPLYGVRVFCIIMIIVDHRFGTYLTSGILNFNAVEEQYRSPFGTMVFHGDLFVDSFFILSGMLVTYCLLVQYEKKILNPGVIILLRYVRLTPLYAFVIFYYATVLKYIGDGPMWKIIVEPEVQDCRDNWWTNILYINNYVNEDHMCMVQSWYLPCDFHYFIIAILLCILIHKKKKLGLTFLAVINLIAVLTPFLITVIYESSAVLYFYPELLRKPKQQFDFMLTYTKSHTRASPYFIGMLSGYVYYRMRGNEKLLNRGYSQLIQTISIVLMVSSILTGTIFYDPSYQYNAIEAGLYASLHRTVWALGSIGLMYVVSFGHAKLIYKFLSWKPWIPISKLVYGAYLVHFQYQLRSVAKKGGADSITYFDVITLALSDVVLAFGTSFILYLTVEAPFRNIFNLLLITQKEVKSTKENEDQSQEFNERNINSSCDSHL